MNLFSRICKNMKTDAIYFSKNFQEQGFIKALILDHNVSCERGESIGIKHPIAEIVKVIKGKRKN